MESGYAVKYQPKTAWKSIGTFRKWDAELMPELLISEQMLLWVEKVLTKAAMMLPLLFQLVLGTPGIERQPLVNIKL